MTRKKDGRSIDVEVHEIDSLETKKLKGKIADISRIVELRREAKELRNRIGL
jgi:hypothetical protein